MSENTTYSVSSMGAVLPGFDAEKVKLTFSEVFGVPAEKASVYTDNKKLIKKGLSQQDAETYRSNLEAIGLAVVIHAHTPGSQKPTMVEKPVPTDSLDSLSLLPSDDELTASVAPAGTVAPGAAAASTKAAGDSPAAAVSAAKSFSCPKCALEQAKTNECIGCGVFVDKFLATASAQASQDASAVESSTRKVVSRNQRDEDDIEVSDGFNIKSLVVPIVVMIVCAFVWKMIALTLGKELGAVSWGIGGAIGASAVAAGVRGQTGAIACAVLVAMAIFGGKYMFMSSAQQEVVAMLNDVSSAEMQQVIYMVNSEAQDFAEYDKDDDSIKSFMYYYDYTEASDPDMVTKAELEEFKENVVPMFEQAENGDVDPREFVTKAVPELGAAMNESVWSLVFESLGVLDFIFLLFGCSTAFGMVRKAA